MPNASIFSMVVACVKGVLGISNCMTLTLAVGSPAFIFSMVVACAKGLQGTSNIMTLTLAQGRGDLKKGPKNEKLNFLGGL